MDIKKIKRLEVGLYAEYKVLDGEYIDENKRSITQPIHADLEALLDQLVPHLMLICEQYEGTLQGEISYYWYFLE